MLGPILSLVLGVLFMSAQAVGAQTAHPSDEVLRELAGRFDLKDLHVAPDSRNKSVSPTCSLWTLQHNYIPGAAVVNFALRPDGKLLASVGDMNGLTRVLHECVSDDVVTWARVISAYSDATVPKVLLDSDSLDLQRLRAKGELDAAAPLMRPLGDGRELRFFIWHWERSRAFRVWAWVPARGPVAMARTEIEP